MNDNFSLPNHDCLNLSYANLFVFDDEMVHKRLEQLDNNPVSSKGAEFTHWKIKIKIFKDEVLPTERNYTSCMMIKDA
jgi:hypothetical protein